MKVCSSNCLIGCSGIEIRKLPKSTSILLCCLHNTHGHILSMNLQITIENGDVMPDPPSSPSPTPLSGPALKRLQKELRSFVLDPPEGLQLLKDGESENLGVWKVRLNGPPNTLYAGEEFTLQFKFGMKYPFDSPEVTFIGESIPVHQHIYSNGHICLSILTDDWSPALSVEAVCLSVISMLASAKEKSRPPDDSFYVKTCSKNPKKTRWWYHDDSV